MGTLQHKVRLYDTSFRRPQLQLDFGEARITALAPEPSGGRLHRPDGICHAFSLELVMALCETRSGSSTLWRCVAGCCNEDWWAHPTGVFEELQRSI